MGFFIFHGMCVALPAAFRQFRGEDIIIRFSYNVFPLHPDERLESAIDNKIPTLSILKIDNVRDRLDEGVKPSVHIH